MDELGADGAAGGGEITGGFAVDAKGVLFLRFGFVDGGVCGAVDAPMRLVGGEDGVYLFGLVDGKGIVSGKKELKGRKGRREELEFAAQLPVSAGNKNGFVIHDPCDG